MKSRSRTIFRPGLDSSVGALGLEHRRLLSGSGLGLGSLHATDGTEADAAQVTNVSSVAANESQPGVVDRGQSNLANDGEADSGSGTESSDSSDTESSGSEAWIAGQKSTSDIGDDSGAGESASAGGSGSGQSASSDVSGGGESGSTAQSGDNSEGDAAQSASAPAQVSDGSIPSSQANPSPPSIVPHNNPSTGTGAASTLALPAADDAASAPPRGATGTEVSGLIATVSAAQPSEGEVGGAAPSSQVSDAATASAPAATSAPASASTSASALAPATASGVGTVSSPATASTPSPASVPVASAAVVLQGTEHTGEAAWSTNGAAAAPTSRDVDIVTRGGTNLGGIGVGYRAHLAGGARSQPGLPPDDPSVSLSETPGPRYADLVSDFTLFDRAAVERAIDRFLDQFDSIAGELTQFEPSSTLLAAVSAAAITALSYELITRRRRSQQDGNGGRTEVGPEEMMLLQSVPNSWNWGLLET